METLANEIVLTAGGFCAAVVIAYVIRLFVAANRRKSAAPVMDVDCCPHCGQRLRFDED